MPTTSTCCECGSCVVAFVATCIEPRLLGVPPSQFLVTVTQGGATVGTCNLAAGSNTITLPGPGEYSWEVRRDAETATGTFTATCESGETIGVSVFQTGYSATVTVRGCNNKPLGGVTVTYTDGQTTRTGVTSNSAGDVTFANLPVPSPATRTVTASVPAGCNFQAGTITQPDTYLSCNGSVSLSLTLVPATGYACHCTRAYPCPTTGRTLTSPFGTVTLLYCDPGAPSVPAWQRCFTFNWGGHAYQAFASFACDELRVYVNTNDPPAQGDYCLDCDPAPIAGNLAVWISEDDTPPPDECGTSCGPASGTITESSSWPGLSGTWTVS